MVDFLTSLRGQFHDLLTLNKDSRADCGKELDNRVTDNEKRNNFFLNFLSKMQHFWASKNS